MRLGIYFGMDWTSDLAGTVALAQEAERLGYDSAWSSEAYGTDAVTPMAWLLARTERLRCGTAIMQMPARTPATTAMTAATLDLMSDGRFLLGLGVSGPQVAEGWHGEAFGRPLARTREYVDIVRAILQREAPVEHHGTYYELPYAGSDATGLGKPLKLAMRPHRNDIPIYLAALGVRNVQLTAEIADGWLPLFYSPERSREVYGAALDAGFAKAGPGAAERFDVAPTVPVLVGDDVAALRDRVKPMVALYVGAMGSRDRNFYNDLACAFGYEAAAREIQELALTGQRDAAAAAVPDALVDEIALVGPRERIADRVEAWKDAGVTTLVLSRPDELAVRTLAELVL